MVHGSPFAAGYCCCCCWFLFICLHACLLAILFACLFQKFQSGPIVSALHFTLIIVFWRGFNFSFACFFYYDFSFKLTRLYCRNDFENWIKLHKYINTKMGNSRAMRRKLNWTNSVPHYCTITIKKNIGCEPRICFDAKWKIMFCGMELNIP